MSRALDDYITSQLHAYGDTRNCEVEYTTDDDASLDLPPRQTAEHLQPEPRPFRHSVPLTPPLSPVSSLGIDCEDIERIEDTEDSTDLISFRNSLEYYDSKHDECNVGRDSYVRKLRQLMKELENGLGAACSGEDSLMSSPNLVPDHLNVKPIAHYPRPQANEQIKNREFNRISHAENTYEVAIEKKKVSMHKNDEKSEHVVVQRWLKIRK